MSNLESDYYMEQKYWWKLRKGIGIKVKIPHDVDKNGNQKYRPAIVIKSYPSHVKVQLLSTQSNKDDYYKITVNNKTGYIRPIYNITISYENIYNFWYEKGKIISLKNDSIFFEKIIEMEYREIFEKKLNLKNYHKFLRKFESKNRNQG